MALKVTTTEAHWPSTTGQALVIQEDATDLPARSRLNFAGGIIATDNPTGDRIDITVAGGAGGAVASVNDQTGIVILQATDVGAVPTSTKAVPNGVATLDSAGQVPLNQLGNAPGGGGSGVSSVNARTGVVDLHIADVAHGFARIDPTRLSATNAASPLTIQTPDGSGQVVEPSVEYIPNGWNGHKWWGLITGYTNGNAATENPAIYYSDNGLNFTPVPGAPFPLVPTPATGNNADPELRLGPDGNLHGFYISANSPAGQQPVWWITSSNGVSWSTPQVLFTSALTTEAPVGPVFLYDKTNNQWICWYVDSHNTALPYPLKRRTCAGTSPGGTWSAPTTCTTIGIPGGRSPWEKHVERRGDQLHMITTFCDNGTGGGNTTLHFGTSDDNGLTWTFNPTPLLSKSTLGWDNNTVYRGDIVPIDDGGTGLYGLWYSAQATTGQWRWGYTTIYGGTGPTGAAGPAGPPGAAGLSPPSLVASPAWSQVMSAVPFAPGANAVWGTRVIVPNDGFLRDIAVYVGTSSGNYRVGIYDTGSALSGSRTRLYASGIIPVGSANGWRIIADPGLAVTAGQELDLAINCDNSTVTLGRVLLNNAALGQLPDAFIPATGGALPKLNWSNSAGSFIMPTTITEANCNPNVSFFPLIARVAAS